MPIADQTAKQGEEPDYDYLLSLMTGAATAARRR